MEKIMKQVQKLRDIIRNFEDNLGIVGDIIGALSLFGIFFICLFFAGVFQ
jgi:hypothetical protein